MFLGEMKSSILDEEKLNIAAIKKISLGRKKLYLVPFL